MAINKSFDPDDSSSEGSRENLAPEPSAPPLDSLPEHNGKESTAPLVGTPTSPADDPVQADQDHEETRTTAAGIAAGIIGLFLGGPILALIAGGGTVYAARQRDGTAGDVARAVGDIALTARDKAKELDEKHNVVDKTKAAAGDAWERTKELDAEHHFMQKIKHALAVAYDRTVAFNAEHHVFEKITIAAGTFFHFIAAKVRGETNASPTP
mmetsp:Transcript_26678/g.78813  ORF Transcript_26678/g.78813 Transcript_26678/m.78813 type:complete len:211 (-) Transcript_26678:80-712(-)|eukprot:CAMPEP_0113528762 /NCGR_PEP_ID=MMETSP0015_2-20120614/2021_1 /TAXON_ID=2838 /ORGANISM="Odontella" /LENGTH=210 /DNA_ID=CAMNT_0000427323 /DNA_START=336 /DNA_END=968 /DNA_ORIENTATION=- /assembly_acc=CAM_ASM_000160